MDSCFYILNKMFKKCACYKKAFSHNFHTLHNKTLSLFEFELLELITFAFYWKCVSCITGQWILLSMHQFTLITTSFLALRNVKVGGKFIPLQHHYFITFIFPHWTYLTTCIIQRNCIIYKLFINYNCN